MILDVAFGVLLGNFFVGLVNFGLAKIRLSIQHNEKQKPLDNLQIELWIADLEKASWNVKCPTKRNQIRKHLVTMPRTIEHVNACEARLN
jgi:hypothetical protein